MRLAVLTGLFACAAVFALMSAEASASTPVEMLDITSNQSTAIDELLAVASPEETTEKAEKEQPRVHVVAENESLAAIAKEYDTTWQRIYDKNTEIQSPDVISKGMELTIPESDEKLKSRELPKPEPVESSAPARTSSSTLSTTTVREYSSSGNGYVAGYCTWYVKNRRPDLPNLLGNAYSWFANAPSYGLSTGYTARVGAVAQRNNHVAYVEKVHGDGTMTISDMNYRQLYEKTVRRVDVSQWRFIY